MMAASWRVSTPPVPTRKIDLNPQGTLQIRAGEDLLVMLDVDLKKLDQSS